MSVQFHLEIDNAPLERLLAKMPQLEGQIAPTMTTEIIRRINERWSRGSPSAPGNPPAIVTGLLRNSITMQTASPTAMWLLIGTEYAAPLEFGTTRMAARPFLWPAMRWMSDERAPQLFAKWLGEAIGGSISSLMRR